MFKYVVLSFLIFQGDCRRVLTRSGSWSCVEEYSEQWDPWDQFCYSSTIGICDYHFGQNMLYCLDGNSTGYKLQRFGFYSYSNHNVSDIRYSSNTTPKDIAVDWVNDEFYIIYDNVMVGSLVHNEYGIHLETVIIREKVAGATEERFIWIRRVNIDPYRRLLFLVANCEGNQSGIVIVSSNLEGNSLKTIVKKPFNYADVKSCVDISEMKIHLTYDKYLYTYNYEGSLISQYKSPNNVLGISAFGNQVYVYYEKKDSEKSVGLSIYMLDQVNTQVREFHLMWINTDDFDIPKLIDSRIQRKKENGVFVCDRKDCPDFCEVHSTGDTCTRDDINTRVNNQYMCKGSYCPEFLLYGGNMACILDYIDEEIVERCLIINNDNSTVIDYHITDGFMYYVDNYYSSSQLKRMAFNFTVSGSFRKRIEERYAITNISGISIDWVGNIIYAITENSRSIMKGDLYGEYNLIRMKNLNIGYPHSEILNEGFFFTALQVDPYRQIIFLEVSIRDHVTQEKKHVIIYDIETDSVTKVFGDKQDFIDTKFYVDLNEMKLYILDHRNLHIYSYDGTLLNTLQITIPSHEFVVFMNVMYVTAVGDTGITRIPLNKTNLPRESYQVQYHGMNKNLPLKMKLLDARIQRRMENGTYICDKKNCPYLCEVRSSGDVCICPKDKAKRRDGITCYECGQSNLTSLTLKPTIVNGNFSGLLDFPWHAVLYKINDTGHWDAICGGSLISSRAVLTAAHCVMTASLNSQPSVLKTEQLKVALGKIQRSWYISEPHGQRFDVAEIRVRKEYKGPFANYASDIAILLSNSSVSFNEYVMPACLDYSLNQLPPHETLDGYVPGFGNTEECVGVCASASELLKYTKTRVMSYTTCFEVANLIDRYTYHRLTADKFCIGNGSESAVQKGDSGGGLTLEYLGLHYVTGVVSVKLAKVQDNNSFKYSFGAFTNVSKHIDWIKENMPADE